MKIYKFNKDDLKEVKSVGEVFEKLGVKKDFEDKEVFGKRAYFYNMVMNDDTYQEIYKILDDNKTHRHSTGVKYSPEALAWSNYSPVSTGPRYEQMSKIVGIIEPNRIYVFTPEDELYEEDPTVADTEKKEG